MSVHEGAFGFGRGGFHRLAAAADVSPSPVTSLDRRMDPEQVSDQTFFLDCVRASVAPGRQSKAAEDAEGVSSILAPELQRILFLASHLRHGLVLRVLLGLSDEDCERLNVRNAGQRACAAAQELARIRETERGMTA